MSTRVFFVKFSLCSLVQLIVYWHIIDPQQSDHAEIWGLLTKTSWGQLNWCSLDKDEAACLFVFLIKSNRCVQQLQQFEQDGKHKNWTWSQINTGYPWGTRLLVLHHMWTYHLQWPTGMPLEFIQPQHASLAVCDISRMKPPGVESSELTTHCLIHKNRIHSGCAGEERERKNGGRRGRDWC